MKTPSLVQQQVINNCSSDLRVSWWNNPPFVFSKNETNGTQGQIQGGLLPLLSTIINTCCGPGSRLVWRNKSRHPRDVEETFENVTFGGPIIKTFLHQSLLYEDTVFFLPVAETPGSLLLVDQDNEASVLLYTIMSTWPLLLVIIGSTGLAGIVIWALDRYINPGEFPRSFIKGFWEGLWWAYITMTTVGYGDRAPKSVPGRVFSFLWILVGIVILAIFTATLTTSLNTTNAGILDISGIKVGVLNGTEDYIIALERGSHPTVFSDIDSMLNALKDNSISGMLVDNFMGLHFTHSFKDHKIRVSGYISHPGMHGMLVKRTTDAFEKCAKTVVLKLRFISMEHISRNMHAVERSPGQEGPEQQYRLMVSNLNGIFGLLGCFAGLFLLLLIWECIYWRPRNRCDKDVKVKSNATRPQETSLQTVTQNGTFR